MPYAIRPEDESVEAALRRIARDEAEAALAAIRAEDGLELRVHEMRKSVKKLRALLRLVRPVLREARAENVRLREAGQGLSGLRDAAVQVQTLRRISAGLEPSRRAALLRPFEEAARLHDAGAGEAALPAFAEAMADLRDRASGWRLRKDGWAALEPGLSATWDAARGAMREARRRPEPERLHEWRKRAKDHWYQARLLQPIWPVLMKPHVQCADELGELLGEANDLAVLRHRLEAAPISEAARSEARDLADLRHAELLARAFPLGRRLFAGPSGALTARWGAWWKLREEG